MPIFHTLQDLIATASRSNPLPSSKLRKTLTYGHNQKDKLTLSLLNAIRPLKLGLKNYLFLGSAHSGKDAVLLYTLIENCKVHELDPEAYFVEVLAELGEPLHDKEGDRARAAKLTPAAIAARNPGHQTEESAKTA